MMHKLSPMDKLNKIIDIGGIPENFCALVGDDVGWLYKKVNRLPGRIRTDVIKRHNKKYKSNGKYAASGVVLDADEKNHKRAVCLSSDDEAIKNRAKLAAAAIASATSCAGFGSRERGFVEMPNGRWKYLPIGDNREELSLDVALDWAEDYARDMQVEVPNKKNMRSNTDLQG